jgi:hypothetical protein
MKLLLPLLCLVCLAGCSRPTPGDSSAGAPPSAPVATKDEQAEAIAALKKAGAEMKVDGTKVVTLYFEQGSKVTDAEVERIGKLKSLEALNLAFSPQISDAGLAPLSGLKNLHVLVLNDTPISDAGLTHLAGLTELRELELNQTKVTDAGLKSLAKLTNLESLELGQTAVGDAGLQELKGLTKLGTLRLKFTKVTDAGVADLQKALPEVKIMRK